MCPIKLFFFYCWTYCYKDQIHTEFQLVKILLTIEKFFIKILEYKFYEDYYFAAIWAGHQILNIVRHLIRELTSLCQDTF